MGHLIQTLMYTNNGFTSINQQTRFHPGLNKDGAQKHTQNIIENIICCDARGFMRQNIPIVRALKFPLVPARLRRLKLVCVVACGPGHMAVRLLHL